MASRATCERISGLGGAGVLLAAGCLLFGSGCAEAAPPARARRTAGASAAAAPDARATDARTPITAAPGRLPSAPGGIPVVVRASTAPRPPVATPQPSAFAPRRVAAPPRRLAEVSDVAPADASAAREIRAMLEDYLAAFNRHDSPALASHWTDGGESIDLASGDVTRGREGVEEVFAALFQADGAATIGLDVESIRLVRHDVAVVDAVSRLAFSGSTAQPAASRLSAVVTREAGGWKIASVRESPLPDARAAGDEKRPLDALDWLVGEWEDAGAGVTAHTRCFWSTGHAFLIRCHTATHDAVGHAPLGPDAHAIPDLLPAGGIDREVTEVIGWDPATATIRSWVFTSEGRFAEGTWTRHGERWLVRMEGRGADAGLACTATLERIGTDELAFRCTGDALADTLPPACDFRRTDRADEPSP